MTMTGVFSGSIDLNKYGDVDAMITSDQPIDDTLFNLTLDADNIEDLQDTTSNYNIEYRTDGIIHLNDNKRIDLLIDDITDTLEKDFNTQAF